MQFYIANDDLYGKNSDDQFDQDGFRVLCFPDPIMDNLVTDFSFLPINEDIDLPVPLDDKDKCLGLSFDLQTAIISTDDYRFRDFAGDEVLKFLHEYNEAYQEFSADGHKLGRYPCFT